MIRPRPYRPSSPGSWRPHVMVALPTSNPDSRTRSDGVARMPPRPSVPAAGDQLLAIAAFCAAGLLLSLAAVATGWYVAW